MAGEEKNKTISKKNTGFPDYLDFDKLRRESIEYIGKLSGKIWTDHNVHDPGITILEALCYALLDLGYRTNLPVEDILARKPADAGKPDDNFFSPAQILSCNPLTVTDYRKLLVDIKGVKNAWLIPAEDVTDICNIGTIYGGQGFSTFLNGLYHVYIELETYPADSTADLNVYAKDILKNVRAALMAHRNLCEDFVDIFILCRLQTGVCASIELEDNADAETVYITIAEKLNEFFSPAPKFYTLQQMLDKDVAMEDVFAGRPYSQSSYGFTDTTELEAIQLKKEIHLSDVYNVIFSVPGVRKVGALQLRICDVNGKSKLYSGWKFSIPENYIPSFSIKCSGFDFTRNGLKVTVDTQKYETLFELGFSHNGKVQYTLPSPYLDSEIPNGIYSDELDDYYSIQNDFPEVYGIGEGDLPDNVPDSRKARALQLKGYLLFFDQLLANYLAQLSNIRSLFALSSPEDKKDRRTYFLNKIETVPDMNRLLRFSPDGSSAIGSEGATLVFPVSNAQWEALKTYTGNTEDRIAAETPFTYASIDEVNIARMILQNDLLSEGNCIIDVLQSKDGSWYYGIHSTAPDTVLLCKKIFASKKEAAQHASSVQYIGVHEDNYRTYITAGGDYSFDVEFNLTSYTGYLQLLEEDDTLYRSRRKDFLDHLLSRFAEKFTDFALLSWQDAQAIPAAENFLTRYDDLSRNRGRAYDYSVNGWNTINSSGFEKKVKALAGLPGDQPTLCHFVVEPCEDYYTVSIRAGRDTLFSSVEKFDSRAEAETAAAQMIRAMKETGNYKARYVGHEKYYQLRLNYGRVVPAVYPYTFVDSNDAERLAGYLVRSFVHSPDEHDVAVNDYIWRADLLNNKGELVAYSVDVREHEDEMKALVPSIAKKISDPKVWTPARKEMPALRLPKKQEGDLVLIDQTGFKLDVNDTIIGHPGKHTYGLLDQEHTFKIAPNAHFDNAKAANEHSSAVLYAAASIENWQTVKDEQTGQYALQIISNGKPEATLVTQYKGEDEAEKEKQRLHGLVREHCYHICETKHPKTWKFYYTLGYTEDDTWRFESETKYATHDEAEKAANEFYEATPQLAASVQKDDIILKPKNKKLPAMRLSHPGGQPDAMQSTIDRLIAQQQDIRQTIASLENSNMAAYVQPDRQTANPGFLYRVVNRDHIPARSVSSYTSREIPLQFKRKIATEYKQQHWFPQICLGGSDVVTTHTDESGVTRYHFEIRFRNLPFTGGEELAIFTGVMGYDSADEAEKAFNQQYLHVLRYASDEKNYGTYISLEPVYLPQPGKIVKTDAIVFVAEKALKLFKAIFHFTWQQELVHVSAAYPVKIIREGSEEFAKLFCTEKTYDPCDCNSNAVVKWKYYFSFALYKIQPGGISDPGWISTRYFDTDAAAMEEFRYFNRLLGYTGNWFIDCDVCAITGEAVYRFFIYEVLAESVECFATRDDAWGPDGVEAFICAVESGKGIYRYARKTDCCYSFYISCGSPLLEHPCTYDSKEQRDKAMDELYNRYKQFVEKRSFAIEAEGETLVINNISGQPIAVIDIPKNRQNDLNICDLLIETAEAVMSPRSRWDEKGRQYFLFDAANKLVLRSHEKLEKISLAQWRNMLEQWACHLPVSRSVVASRQIIDATGSPQQQNLYKYCIELKIPGFSACGNDEAADEPCTCNTPPANTDPYCYVAWKSPCCLSSCEEVSRVMAAANRLLKDFRNYQPVIDCGCGGGGFGIALHSEGAGIKIDTHEDIPREAGGIKSPAYTNLPGIKEGEVIVIGNRDVLSGRIIARNPQCYVTPDDVCEATDTLWNLVNAAGLHVVEHILLRPHCETDCECSDRRRYCNEYANCHYPPYTNDSDDPCNTSADIPFLPGNDPYSFIATVIMPAWPSIFRDASKRKQAEHIIYSEAPAHVLLRILWLRPMDFCRLEANIKEWRRWLAGMNSCASNFSVCNFLRLLYVESYDCLPDCTVCLPCTDPGTRTTSNCADDRKKQLNAVAVGEFDFLNLVNTIFCMGRFNCGDQRVIVADEIPRTPTEQPIPGTQPPAVTVSPSTAPAEAAPPTVAKTTEKTTAAEAKQETPKAVAKEPAKPAEAKKAVIAAKPAEEKKTVETVKPVEEKKAAISPKEKAQFVNSRHKRYVNLAAGVVEHSGENPLAVKTRVFVQSADPDAMKLEQLVKEIIRNKKPADKGAKALNKNQALDLVQASVCHYLDKVSFNGKDAAKIDAIKPSIELMKKAKIDLQAVHNYWDAAGISVYEPELDTGLVKKLFTGAKK